MHAKPDLRVFLKWMIAGSGSVITDVITLNRTLRNLIHTRMPLQFANVIADSQLRSRQRQWPYTACRSLGSSLCATGSVSLVNGSPYRRLRRLFYCQAPSRQHATFSLRRDTLSLAQNAAANSNWTGGFAVQSSPARTNRANILYNVTWGSDTVHSSGKHRKA